MPYSALTMASFKVGAVPKSPSPLRQSLHEWESDVGEAPKLIRGSSGGARLSIKERARARSLSWDGVVVIGPNGTLEDGGEYDSEASLRGSGFHLDALPFYQADFSDTQLQADPHTENTEAPILSQAQLQQARLELQELREPSLEPSPAFPLNVPLPRLTIAERCAEGVGSTTNLTSTNRDEDEEGDGQSYSCLICMDEDFTANSMFTVENCGHKFCKDCMQTYVQTKIDGNQVGPLQMICPGKRKTDGWRMGRGF